MIDAKEEAERMLETLRRLIRERGFTQLQIQQKLEWGRSYISQLLTKQKSLRVEPLLQIVDAIGLGPAEFFAEHFKGKPAEPEAVPAAAARPAAEIELELRRRLDLLQSGLAGLVHVLVERELIGANESAAVLTGRSHVPSPSPERSEEAPRPRRKRSTAGRFV